MGRVAEILEIAVFVLIVTQMLIPWAFEMPMWPLFRARKTGKLLGDIERENQVDVEAEFRKELDALRRKHSGDPQDRA